MSTITNPVGWFEIHVTDLARASRFDSAVFDQPPSALPSADPSIDMCVFNSDPSAHGVGGALVKHPMKQPTT
jgi:hypothetical protein